MSDIVNTRPHAKNPQQSFGEASTVVGKAKTGDGLITDVASPPPQASASARPHQESKDSLSPGVESINHYFQSLEERVTFLEAEISRLTGSSFQHGEGDLNSPGYSTKRNISANSKPLILDRDHFDGRYTTLGPIHAVELLVHEGTVTKIRIRSEQMLLSLYRALDLSRDPSKSVVMNRPFKALMVLRDRYEFLVSFQNLNVIHNLKLLKRLVDVDLASEWRRFRDLRERIVNTISFLHMQYLFLPGDVVVEGKWPTAQAYRIRSVRESLLRSRQDSATSNMDNASSVLTLECFSIGCDGQKFGPVPKTFTIVNFPGSTQITKLPVVPIEYYKGEDLRAPLIDRGKLFYYLRKPRHMRYSGMSLDEVAEEIKGEVIVDLELYYRENPRQASSIGVADLVGENDKGTLRAACTIPGCDCMKQKQNPDTYDDSAIDKQLTEEFLKNDPTCMEVTDCSKAEERDTLVDSQLLLLPNFIRAFNLRGRKWHLLAINELHALTYPADSFDYLVLPHDHKELLASLVSSHISGNVTSGEPVNDITIGKGKGLNILLHGAPGVGKTTTAECVAAFIRRPLLPITAADIGDTAQDVERNLMTFFNLSQRWGCILLFDEADIVLQARDRTNMQRNAIVSVCLRAMEYYTGILILTTNRVGTFDAAFGSRMHLVLYYPPLDRDMSMRIWEMTLRKAGEAKNIRINLSAIMRFVKDYWNQQDRKFNGRDIRNAVQSAVSLAEYQHKLDEDSGDHDINAPSLSRHHLEAIFNMTNKFDEYMTAVHGGTDELQAKRVGERADDFGEKPKYVSRAASKPLYTTSRQSERLNRLIKDIDTDSDEL